MDTPDVNGLTIISIEEGRWDTFGSDAIRLHCVGAVLEIRPVGWEGDSVEIERKTIEQVRAENAQIKADHEQRRVEQLAREAKRQATIDTMRASFGADKAGFQRWLQNFTGSTAFSRALKAEFAGAMKQEMQAHTRLLFRNQPEDTE